MSVRMSSVYLVPSNVIPEKNGNTVVSTKTKTVAIVAPQRSNSLDYLNFEEKRQIIASSLSLSDFLHVGNAAKEIKEGVTTVIVGKFFRWDLGHPIYGLRPGKKKLKAHMPYLGMENPRV